LQAIYGAKKWELQGRHRQVSGVEAIGSRKIRLPCSPTNDQDYSIFTDQMHHSRAPGN